MDLRERILIVCTHNSARSQMAEGFLRAWGGERYVPFSAGTEPADVRPEAIRVMNELGIDISSQRSKSVADFLGEDFDVVITVCDRARENCPVFPGAARTEHHDFRDPSEVRGGEAERLAAFRQVRDEIAAWVRTSLLAEGAARRT
jgi:arsenate reductase